MAWSEKHDKVYKALNELLTACELEGNRGTGTLHCILEQAIIYMDWSNYEYAVSDYDLNKSLTQAIVTEMGIFGHVVDPFDPKLRNTKHKGRWIGLPPKS